MRLRIRPDSPTPIYEQITTQVVYAIAAGDIAVGELLPSVRDLAQRLIVNANTVARAFQELEREGILEVRRGLGVAVAPDAVARCKARRRDLVRQTVREAVREAVAAGLAADEMLQLVAEEWPDPAAERAGAPNP